MSRVLVLVEGPTERSIVDQVFTPELAQKGIYLYPRVVGKPGHKGGNKFAVVRQELKSLIRQEPSSIITMLFDYYGLPDDWPMLDVAKGKRADEVPAILEPAIMAALAQEVGTSFNPNQFVPYIQLHEIESILFAGPKEMAQVFQCPQLENEFIRIVNDCGGCEMINNDRETAPSKRIQRLFPKYRKGSGVNAHAYRIAKRIGLNKIRMSCPHFDSWFIKLENLARCK